MRRVLITAVLASLTVVQALSAQTAAQARVIRLAVIVEQPRGDAPIVTRIPPGAIIDVLSRNGDWYQVALTQELSVARRSVGWVYRDVLELLPNQPAVGVTTTRVQPATPIAPAPALAPQPVAPTPAAAPQPAAPQPAAPRRQRYLNPGTTELIIAAAMIGTSFDGDTSSAFTLSGTVGFVAPAKLEPVVLAEFTKASDIDAFGSIGGGLLVNFAGETPIVPFVGGTFGTTIGTSTIVDEVINETQYLIVTGGFRVMMPRGGGSLVVRPFFQRFFLSSDLFDEVPDVNQFGVSIGVSILF